MAKQISRSVKVYTYTFIRTEKKDGKITVADSKDITMLERLGTRKAAEYIKANPELTGYVVGAVAEGERTYAMDLDAFIAAATIVKEDM